MSEKNNVLEPIFFGSKLKKEYGAKKIVEK